MASGNDRPTPVSLARLRMAVRGMGDGCEVTILRSQRGSPWPDLVGLGPAIHVSGAEILAGLRGLYGYSPRYRGRRRALRSWMGLVDRGYLGPAGVAVEHANGRLGSRPHTIWRADQDADVYFGEQ